jgi:hypothetical protein
MLYLSMYGKLGNGKLAIYPKPSIYPSALSNKIPLMQPPPCPLLAPLSYTVKPAYAATPLVSFSHPISKA